MFFVTILKEVRWGHRVERPEGVEIRRVDNRKGSAEVVRKFQVSRQWTETLALKNSESVSAKISSSFGKENLAQISADATEELSQEMTRTETLSKTLSEEVIVKVPTGVLTEMSIEWKSLWRQGEAELEIDLLESYKQLYSYLPIPGASQVLAAHLMLMLRPLYADRNFENIILEFEMADGYTFDLKFESTKPPDEIEPAPSENLIPITEELP